MWCKKRARQDKFCPSVWEEREGGVKKNARSLLSSPKSFFDNGFCKMEHDSTLNNAQNSDQIICCTASPCDNIKNM